MKIVFCGGGTAGHVTPNLAIMEQLKDHEIYYIGSNGMEQRLTQPYVENKVIREYCLITAGKLQRKITLSNLKLPFELLKSIKQCTNYLKKLQPNVVFSKGGYVGLPVIIAAHKLKIPTIVHESDMTLGLANKISTKYATQLLTTFDCHKKGKTVGAIIRNSVLEGKRANGLSTMGFKGEKPLLLVMGGSLGATALNEAICKNSKLADFFDIFVITGKGKRIDCDFVKQKEYVTNIADVFAATDVCLTRAGSNSLVELTLANIPFVTVPLTKCSRGEQVKNAKWFCDNGCGFMLNEDNLEVVDGYLKTAYFNRSAIATKQKNMAFLNGTDKVVQYILRFA